MIRPDLQAELEETFLFALHEAGFSRAIAAVAGAAIIDAVGPSKRTRRIPVHLSPAEVRAVCHRMRVSSEDVFSRGRGRQAVTDARAVAMWLMYGPGVSYHDVGAAFGRDHSSVVAAVQKVERSVGLLSIAREIEAALARREAA
jgi:hypothetical protein